MSELEEVADLLGDNTAFKIRTGMLLSGEDSPVAYLRAAVRSYVDLQMDEAERGDAIVVDADEWDRVRETASEALAKWERLKAETGARELGEVRVKQPDEAVRHAQRARQAAERVKAAPEASGSDRMVDQVRAALATVQHCDQRAAKSRERKAAEGIEPPEPWETPKPVSKPKAKKKSPEPVAEVVEEKPTKKPEPVPAGSLWSESSDQEVKEAILAVTSPDPDDAEYTMNDLAHGIGYVDKHGVVSGRAFRFRMDAFKVPFRTVYKEGTTRHWRVYVKRDILASFGVVDG